MIRPSMTKVLWNCDSHVVGHNHIGRRQIDAVQGAVPVVFQCGQQVGGGYTGRYTGLNNNVWSRGARHVVYEAAEQRIAGHYGAAADAGVRFEG